MPSWNVAFLFLFILVTPIRAPKHSVDVISFWTQSLKMGQDVFALASKVPFNCWRQVCFSH